MKKKKDFDVTKKYSARSYGLFLLSKRDYSIHKIKTKTLEKGYSAEEVEDAINFFIDMKYLNDEKYAEIYIRNKKEFNGWGANRIRMELSMKEGVSNSIIDSIMPEFDFEEEKIKQYIKKYGITKPKDPKEYQKRMAFLARKGFSPQIPNLEELESLQK